jgi:tRNA-2-methylthio-N6-dimethylallyladenosine synthase
MIFLWMRRGNEIRYLLELQKRISRAKNQRLVGGLQEVLVEGSSKKDASSQLIGRTRTNKIVVFESRTPLVGKLVKVKIEEVTAHTLIGIVDGEK